MNVFFISYISTTICLFIFMLVIFFLCRHQIKNKLKLLLTKYRDYGVLMEMKDNRSFKEHIIKFSGDTIKLGEDKIYNINPNHVLINDDYGVKGVVVSENLKSSIDPKTKDNTGLDMQTLTKLIQRAKSVGQQEALDFIKKITENAPIVILAFAIAMLLQIFFLWKILLSINGGKVL